MSNVKYHQMNERERKRGNRVLQKKGNKNAAPFHANRRLMRAMAKAQMEREGVTHQNDRTGPRGKNRSYFANTWRKWAQRAVVKGGRA